MTQSLELHRDFDFNRPQDKSQLYEDLRRMKLAIDRLENELAETRALNSDADSVIRARRCSGFPVAMSGPDQDTPQGVAGSGGRLTVDPNDPVPYDFGVASTIYYVPYKNDDVALYDATEERWNRFKIPAGGVSLALSGLAAFFNYDVFLYDNAGTPAMELVLWDSDLVRVIALSRQDGVYVKSTDATRRYIGTIRTISSTETFDGLEVSTQFWRRYVWNVDNRAQRFTFNSIGTGSFALNSTSFILPFGGAGNPLVAAVIGIDEAQPVHYEAEVIFAKNGNPFSQYEMAVALDSTSVPAPLSTISVRTIENGSGSNGLNVTHRAQFLGNVVAGHHFWRMIHRVTTGNVRVGSGTAAQNVFRSEIWG